MLAARSVGRPRPRAVDAAPSVSRRLSCVSTPTKIDSQRSRVYAAERELEFILANGGTIEHFGSTFTLPAERKFGNVDSVAPYLRKVLAFAPVARLPRASVPVTVRERRGNTLAHYERDTSTIAIPPYGLGSKTQQGWALRETLVLHELAHHLCPDSDPGHGPVFVAHELYLVEHVIGPEAAHLLRVSCYEHNVKIGGAP